MGIIAVCSQIHTKHINTLCGQNVELQNVSLVLHIPTTELRHVITCNSQPPHRVFGPSIDFEHTQSRQNRLTACSLPIEFPCDAFGLERRNNFTE